MKSRLVRWLTSPGANVAEMTMHAVILLCLLCDLEYNLPEVSLNDGTRRCDDSPCHCSCLLPSPSAPLRPCPRGTPVLVSLISARWRMTIWEEEECRGAAHLVDQYLHLTLLEQRQSLFLECSK